MIKPLTILIDYMSLATGQYKWKMFNTLAIEKVSDADIMAIVPDLLISMGETGKVRIGLVAVSDQIINIEEFEDFNDKYREPTPENHEVFETYWKQYGCRLIFADADY